MINILPEYGLQEVKREYRMRLFALLLLALSFVCIAFAALLFPSYLQSRFLLQELTAQETLLNTQSKSEVEAIMTPLTRAKDATNAFLPLLLASAPSATIEAILKARPPQVRLVQMTFEKGGTSLKLSGTSATRDALLSFSRKLKELPNVASADVPVSDLAKSENVTFSLTILFNEAKENI